MNRGKGGDGDCLRFNEIKSLVILPQITHPDGDDIDSDPDVKARVHFGLTLKIINASKIFGDVAIWAIDFSFPSFLSDLVMG